MTVTANLFAAYAFSLALMAAEPAVPPATPAEAPPTSAPAPATAPAPAPVPIPTMARSLEAALSRVRYLERLAGSSPTVVNIERSLQATSARIASLEASLAAADPDDVSHRELNKIRINWMDLDATLSDWESSLETLGSDLENARLELRSLEETWQATLASDPGGGVPAVLIEKIDTLLINTAALRQTLRDRASALLLIQDEVSSSRIRAREAQERLDVVAKESRDRLFAIESDPLWTTLLAGRPAAPLGFQAVESWRTGSGEVAHLLRRESGRFIFQLALFAMLTAAGWFLVSRMKDHVAADRTAEEAVEFLDRPVSAAGVLTLFATFWIYPPTAIPLHGTALTLLLFPFFRFLPKLTAPILVGPAYALGVLFLLDRVHDFALPHSLFSRLVLLLVGCLGVACWAWALRNIRDAAPGTVPTRITGRRILVRIAIALLLVAIVANVIGNVSLAEQLTVVAVKGAFAAALLYIVARVVESLYVLLLAFMASRGAITVIRHRALLEQRGHRIIGAAAAGVWVIFVLWIMRVIEQSRHLIASIVTKQWSLGQYHIALGSIVAFAVALTIGIVAARVLRFILDEGVFPRMTLPRGVPAAVSATVSYLVVTIGFVTALLAAGLKLSEFTFLAGAFGVGIGFGLQNVVNNFVSGLILLYERPIQVGDVLEVGTIRGRVSRIGIRSSTLATFDGAEVIVPNATLIATDVVNWTLSDRLRRVDIHVSVSYGSDPAAVLAVLGRVARAHTGVLAVPEPMALFMGFGESGLNFELRCWTPEYDAWVQVGSEIRAAVFAAFKEAGIEIPFPQRDLHVKSIAAAAGDALTGRGESVADPKRRP
jgi:potassium efflux system protein